MTNPIFVQDNQPEERPVDYVANPLRVQLPAGQTRGPMNVRTEYAQLDLIALANEIVRVGRQNEELARELTNTRTALENLRADHKRVVDVMTSPPVWKLLMTLAKSEVEPEYDPDEDLL